jgi:hypothetical protein
MTPALQFFSFLVILAAVAIISLIRRGRGTGSSFNIDVAESIKDVFACEFLLECGICSSATVRTALQKKAAQIASGQISESTSVVTILLNQGEITSREAEAAYERSRELVLLLRSRHAWRPQ